MRRIVGVAAVAAGLGLVACETSEGQRRQGRAPARYNDTTTRPVENRMPPGEYRPNEMSPMRGNESFPAPYPGTESGPGPAVGGSADTPTGSSIDRRSSTPPAGTSRESLETDPSTVTPGPYGGQGSTGETGTGPTGSDRLQTPRYQQPGRSSQEGSDSSSGTMSSEPSDSTGNVGSGARRQGRTGQEPTRRPRTGTPPSSDPLGNTNSDVPDVSGTPPIPDADPQSTHPYDRGATTSPPPGGSEMDAADGGSLVPGAPPDDLPLTY